MKALALLAVAVLVAGCAGGKDRDPDGPGTGPAPDDRHSTPSEDQQAAEAEPAGPRVERHEGNLTFEQAAAVVCPLYVESAGRSSAAPLDLAGATEFDFSFDWTPAVPAFEGAIVGLGEEGTSTLPDAPQVRGRSTLAWRMDAQQLAEAPEDALLHIVGPACLEDQAPGQQGLDYEQVIHFVGTVTYPA